jgi:hypothetical protein
MPARLSPPSLIFLALLLGGCAALPKKHFEDFRRSLARAQEGLEAQAERNVEWAREAEIQALAESKTALLSAYMLKEAPGAGWSPGRAPDYWGAREVRVALERMDAAVLGYADLLAAVAAGETVDEARTDALAARWNRGLKEADEALTKAGRMPEGDRRRAAAGASAGLAEALRAFARGRRRGDLRAAVSQNQPWIDDHAARCLALVQLLRADLKASYADQMESLQARWDDKRAPGRATLSRSLFNLNEAFAESMESLQGLGSFYAALPAAHAELGKALDRRARGRAALAALEDAAGRAARRTRELERAR